MYYLDHEAENFDRLEALPQQQDYATRDQIKKQRRKEALRRARIQAGEAAAAAEGTGGRAIVHSMFMDHALSVTCHGDRTPCIKNELGNTLEKLPIFNGHNLQLVATCAPGSGSCVVSIDLTEIRVARIDLTLRGKVNVLILGGVIMSHKIVDGGVTFGVVPNSTMATPLDFTKKLDDIKAIALDEVGAFLKVIPSSHRM